MRHYETDSTPAAARLLALTVLADGGLDRNEVDTMMHTDLARRLGIGSVEFERILREYCDDLMLSAHYLDGVRLKVADEVLDLLLEDIADPRLQQALLRTMQDIVSADGVETSAEVDVLARALEKWGAYPKGGALNGSWRHTGPSGCGPACRERIGGRHGAHEARTQHRPRQPPRRTRR